MSFLAFIDPAFPSLLVAASGVLVAAAVATIGVWNHRLMKFQTQIQSSQMVLQTKQTEIQDALRQLKEQEQALALERFKLDIFEKRLAVYEAIRDYLIGVRRERKTGQDAYIPLANTINNVFFLFGDDVVAFTKGIKDKAGELVDESIWSRVRADAEIKKPEHERHADVVRVLQIEEQLRNDLERLPEAFAPYMKFETWKP